MKMTEHDYQVNFVRWFRNKYPEIMIFAIPNGGARGDNPVSCKIRGAILKAEGVTAGVPDLFIPEWRLFVEMKSDYGTISESQHKVIEYLRKIGYEVLVIHGFDDNIKNKISSYYKK